MNTTTRSYGKTRSATTASRQGTQHPIAKTIPKRLLIRIRIKNSRTSRSSKSIRSNMSEINKLKKAMKKSFTTLEDKIDELENEDSDLTSSDSQDSDGDSYFQFHKNFMEPQKGFQMFQIERNNRYHTPGVDVVLQWAPEKRIKKVLLENKHDDYIDVNIRKVILLDRQSTMDLF